MNETYRRATKTTNLSERGRIILAHGEVTGHYHEVLCNDPLEGLSAMEFFEEPDGRRVLLITQPCVLRHAEHAPIALDPRTPAMYRQGDVLLRPLGPGAWHVMRQREYTPESIRYVAD